jgi:hypothetical protein
MKNQITHWISFASFAQTLVTFAVKKRYTIFKFLYLLLILFHPLTINCQTEKLPEIIVNIGEELAADDSDPEAVAVFIGRLTELAENPVKINSADDSEISRLFFLSDFQVKILSDYIHSSGSVISVYELANIPGFDKETAAMMIPFITIDSEVPKISDFVRWRNSLLTNLSVRSGNNDTISPGSPWKILSKYKVSAGCFSGGITVEKDPEEKFFSGTPSLPDFLSAYFAYNGKGAIRRLIVGDYSARFGQGTNINTSVRTGLSLTAPGYMSGRDEIRPYTSTDENNFFRGVAADLSFKNLGISLFYSKNRLDAALGSESGSSKDFIESFYTAGIHNTTSLLLKKDAVSEQAFGINVSYNLNKVRMGFTFSGDEFSLPVSQPVNDPADIYKFKGRSNNLCTFSYNGLIKNILLYGEFSYNKPGRIAFVQGLSFRPSDRLTINVLYRKYRGGYSSFHGKGPGGISATGNEEGITGNFSFEAARHLFISGGCDIRNYLWLKYLCSAPTHGIRKELKIRYLPTEKLTAEALYSYRLTMADYSENTGIPEQNQIISRSLKCSLRYSYNEYFTLGTRLDYKISGPSSSKGVLLLQDVSYRFRSVPVSFWIRFCIFHTDDWDSRIYTYENDLLYSFSIPALSGEGSRSYIMVKWKISDRAEVRVKYGITSLINCGTAISDNEELKIQVRMEF